MHRDILRNVDVKKDSYINMERINVIRGSSRNNLPVEATPQRNQHCGEATESSPLTQRANGQSQSYTTFRRIDGTLPTEHAQKGDRCRSWTRLIWSQVDFWIHDALGRRRRSLKLTCVLRRWLVAITIFVFSVVAISFLLRGAYRKTNHRADSLTTEDDTDTFAVGQGNATEPPTGHAADTTGPVWLWDFNQYNPQQIESDTQGHVVPATGRDVDPLATTDGAYRRNLLIAQLSGASVDSSSDPSSTGPPMQLISEFSEISSRPNRAYAREWGRNYVRYLRSESAGTLNSTDDVRIPRTCWNADLDRAMILKTILRNQHPNRNQNRSEIQYDAVLLLPVDAIIMDLDYDMEKLIPDDKLLALAKDLNGSDTVDKKPLQSGVVIFNLRHVLATQLVELWWDELARVAQRDCRQQRKSDHDLNLLVQQVRYLLEEEGDGAEDIEENLESHILCLSGTEDGFILEAPSLHVDASSAVAGRGAYCIKTFSDASDMSKTGQLLSRPGVTIATLQATADAVCYRYYPKCEVL